MPNRGPELSEAAAYPPVGARCPFRVGSCTLTGEQIFEVISKYASDHEMSGFPLRVGGPLENAERCHVVMTDGGMMQVTLSTAAADSIHADPSLLRTLHNRIVDGLAWESENKNRVLIGAEPLTAPQQEKADEALVKLVSNRPLGIYAREKWQTFRARMKERSNGS